MVKSATTLKRINFFKKVLSGKIVNRVFPRYIMIGSNENRERTEESHIQRKLIISFNNMYGVLSVFADSKNQALQNWLNYAHLVFTCELKNINKTLTKEI